MSASALKRFLWWALWLLGLAGMLTAIYAIIFYVPTERTMGIVQRIFYFHVPVAGVTFVAFFVVFIASILFLVKKDRKWDLLGRSAGQIGLLFCTLVLLSGPLWARPVWNTWWTWDPRLTTTLILWFIYVAYLMVGPASGGGVRGARMAAVFGIVGFIDVPIVFMAIRWWRTIHPVVFRLTGTGLEPSMLLTFLISLFTFQLLFFAILIESYRLMRLKDEVELLKQVAGPGAREKLLLLRGNQP